MKKYGVLLKSFNWKTFLVGAALFVCLTSPAYSSTILLTGGDSSDGWQLDPSKVVFAVNCEGNATTLQGVNFVNQDGRLLVQPREGWYSPFPQSIDFGGTKSANDLALETVANDILFSAPGIDFQVSLLPNTQYKLDFECSVFSYPARSQTITVNGATGTTTDAVDMDSTATSVYLTSVLATSDANGLITGSFTPGGGTYAGDGVVWGGFAVSAVPEPGTMMLFAVAVALLAAGRLTRRQK